MTTQQPEALRLARWLEHRSMSGVKPNDLAASTELLRLHAENEELKQQIAATQPAEQGMDAQRWQIVRQHISAEYIAGHACFVVRIEPVHGENIMRGSVAQHFTKAVDDRAKQIKIAHQAWQAARRAPVVPWGVESAAEAIYEADKRMWLTSVEYQKLHDDDKGRLRAMARAALAAAPQPPEAAPVELPEPFAYVEHHKAGDNLWFDHPGGKHSPLYTEQQVRELLAAHGIK